MRCFEVFDGGVRSVDDMQQGPKLIAAEDTDLAITMRTNREGVYDQIEPHTRKNIANTKQGAKPKDYRILVF